MSYTFSLSILQFLNVRREQHVPWIYALRFLRVSLAVKAVQTQEHLAATSNLKAIVRLANDRGDSAIAATASAVEALLHVNRSNTSESIEHAQRALAAARSLQLSPKARIPQLEIMTHFVDLLCSLFRDDLDNVTVKMGLLHSRLDGLSNNTFWTQSGQFLVAMSQQSAQTMQAAGSAQGIVCTDGAGQLCLQINWLPKDEIYTLGYILSAAAVFNRNAQDRKAETYLNEALCKGDQSSISDC